MQTTIREEQILNKTATFKPITKDEQFLSEVIGGGGGIETCEMTITMPAQGLGLYFSWIGLADGLLYGAGADIAPGTTEVASVVKNSKVLTPFGDLSDVSLEGDVEAVYNEEYESYELIVTGNCSITIG